MMKCVNVLLIILITLVGSGCASPAPLERVVYGATGNCGTPQRPVLPIVNGAESFDTVENIAALMLMIDLLKGYAAQQESALTCANKQLKVLKEQGNK